MRNLILSMCVIATLNATALTVTSTPGELHNIITGDLSAVTELTITGEMDARDFRFIADSLNQITDVDLSATRITAFTNTSVPTLGRVFQFAADELPTLSFMCKPIKHIALPVTLRTVGEAAFTGCTALEVIDWSTTLDSIAPYAFAGCEALTEITLPSALTALGHNAFAYCTSLTSVKVGDEAKLSHVGECAFVDCCLLNEVNLGDNISEIGEGAFANTAISTLDLSNLNNLKVVNGWIASGSPVEAVVLPATVTTIAEGALLGTKDIAQLTLPATVGYIGDLAMAGMTGLTELTAEPETVPELGEQVWFGVNQPGVTLRVPPLAKIDYQEALQWQEFNIVSNLLKGDINLDGAINVADVNVILNIILNEGTDDEDLFSRADVNEDSKVNVGDVNSVLNIILQQRVRRRASHR